MIVQFTGRMKIGKKWTTVPHTTTTNPTLINTYFFLCQDQVSKQCKLNTTDLITIINRTINNATTASVTRTKWTYLVWYAYAHGLKTYAEYCHLFVGCYTMLSFSRLYSIEWQDNWRIMDWKDVQESGCNLVEILSWKMSGGTEENIKNMQDSRCGGRDSNRASS
jgi:hypothetical protein